MKVEDETGENCTLLKAVRISLSILFNLYIVSGFGYMFLTRNCKKLNINMKSSHKKERM